LHSNKFKAFYPKDLQSNKIMTRILKAGYPDILLELLKDRSYVFDKKWIFIFIAELLKKKDEEHEYIRENNE
jgi:hypothetical protein